MAEVARQLESRGLLVRKGTLIDATLTQSVARRPRMDEGKTSPADPQARFGTNNERGRFVFGYKMHMAMDEGSALVRAAVSRSSLAPTNATTDLAGRATSAKPDTPCASRCASSAAI
jgi:hypothetical protein